MSAHMLTRPEIDALLREAARLGPSRAKRRGREIAALIAEGRDRARCIPVTGHVSGKDTPRSERA